MTLNIGSNTRLYNSYIGSININFTILLFNFSPHLWTHYHHHHLATMRDHRYLIIRPQLGQPGLINAL
jgi:hypothetical protein